MTVIVAQEAGGAGLLFTMESRLVPGVEDNQRNCRAHRVNRNRWGTEFDPALASSDKRSPCILRLRRPPAFGERRPTDWGFGLISDPITPRVSTYV